MLLSHTANQPSEEVKLIRPFDAFGDYGKRKLVRQPQDAFQHGYRWLGRGLARDEGAVDLEDVNGQARQRAEGRDAGTEVIDGDAHAGSFQYVQGCDVAADVSPQSCLGDLDQDLVGLHRWVGQDVSDGRQALGVDELKRGEVDRDP